MSNAPPSILDRLRARKTASEPTPDLSKRGTPAGIDGPPTVQPEDSLARKVHAAGPVMVRTAFGDAPVEPGNQPAEGQTVVQPGQINPPESALPPAPASNVSEPKAEPKASERFRRTKEEMAAGLSVEQAKAARAGHATPVEAPKSEPAPVAAPSGPSVSLGSVSEKVEAKSKPGKPIPLLFINCFPVAGQYVLASSLAAKANEKICADQSIYDYRAMQYGAGPGALRHAVMEMIDAADDCPPIMVDTASPEGQVLVNDLESRAVTTIRGLR